jgi:hypothetical protein
VVKLRDYQRTYQREHRRQQAAYWYAIVNAYKITQGCVLCGFRSLRAGYFDLDHADRSQKEAVISRLCCDLTPGNAKHRDRFTRELQKCQVLCVACHREKTAADLSWTGDASA